MWGKLTSRSLGKGSIIEEGQWHVDEHWVLSGIEKGTTKSFMVVVEDRTADTLATTRHLAIHPPWHSYNY